MYDVFISYSRQDSDFADRIEKRLREEGLSCFVDRKGISGGEDFPAVLSQAILDSGLLLYLASSNSYQSLFTRKEVLFAVNNNGCDHILPLLLDDSPMPKSLEFLLSDVNWRQLSASYRIGVELIADIKAMLNRNTAPSVGQRPKMGWCSPSSGFHTLGQLPRQQDTEFGRMTTAMPLQPLYQMDCQTGPPPGVILPTLQRRKEENWFYLQEGKQRGPCSRDVIRELLRNQLLTLDSLVWTSGMEAWKPVRECLGLV
jgi:hypothetical protein